MISMRKLWAIGAGCVALLSSGCGTIFGDSSADASEADFSSAWDDDNILAQPPNLLVDVELQLLQIDNENSGRLLPSISQARLKHEGSLYWLEADLPPEVIWTRARSFWLEQGFGLDVEVPEIGILETDWRQDRSKIVGTGFTELLDAAFERLHDTGERYRFRMRIERGDKPGTTFIFITSRLVAEKPSLGKIGFEVLPPDPTLEAEMLRRMLIYFRADSEAILTLSEIGEIAKQDKLYDLSGPQITVYRDRTDSWRRLLVALDRSGFTVVNASEDDGQILIRSADPTVPKEEQSFFSQFFGSGQGDGESYEVVITIASSVGERTVVSLPDDENGQRIASLISGNL